SRLAAQGVALAEIAAIMGNSVATIEKHYLRFFPSRLKSAMATLEPPEPVNCRPTVADKKRPSHGEYKKASEALVE
ncbi:MAG: hypothetical protein O7A63_10965, partial [Acidobacteria bacterium]|nr:hypothetical protein [Acidobacteriota bacterium]